MAIQKHDVRCPDGVFEEHYWSPINSPMFGADRRIKYIVHRVEEVTEFVRQKSEPSGGTVELSARVQQMEAEVFQSSQNLQAANQQLEAANKELEAFSYSVSHDLRAPLRHINGFSQALLEDYADKLDEEGRGYLQEVRGASREMGQLIDDVLQLARVTRSEMRKGIVDLSELARTIVVDLQKADSGRIVTVNIERRLSVQGDKRLLHIMLTNLLGNAWKFTSKRTPATIDFGREQQGDESVYFVRDNGAGFDMAYVDKLFGAFQRLHTVSEFDGTGIGLATVQRIVRRHGGHVWGEGGVNEGAAFYFTLANFKETGNGQQSDLTG
jgi:light-regulated signal transduction histidine kinase (bacteriophytochrome)